MNRTRFALFWLLAATNIVLALVVTSRLPLPALTPTSAVHFPATDLLLTIYLSALILCGTALSIGERVLLRRSEGGDAARGVTAFFSTWWTAGVGLTIAVLTYQAYLIGWSRGALPPMDLTLHTRVAATLMGAFQIYTGNALPRIALADSAGKNPKVALREARHSGWVETLSGIFLIVLAWTAPPVVIGPVWGVNIVALIAYKGIRHRLLVRESRAVARDGAA